MTRLYRVAVLVLPRRGARDPEGETLARELRRLGYGFIEAVRAGKVFVLEVEADSAEEAHGLAVRAARETRLYNPVVSEAVVVALAEGGRGAVPGD